MFDFVFFYTGFLILVPSILLMRDVFEIVAVFIPAIRTAARQGDISVSKFMMPLCFFIFILEVM